ncbi:MAG: tRNA (adenosine(37)-N6)-threonylcarbamoyltransferase complex dimerization subunit type 1 TsaB [Eubacteriaceae bacterium]|nr:tRNA (adenosine(37)-N6)-threonylcarbamoyltransferase complex dimerization subunit type 1 TsaB [Eubacteriaceae bacterium]
MRVLAFDTSTRATSCAIVDNGKLLGEMYTDFKLKSSEKILIMLKHLLDYTRVDMADISLLAVNTGPGSFTGIRVGAATAKAIGHALGLDIVPVSSLEATAYQHSSFEGLICPIFDAQQGNVYTGAYDFKGQRMRCLYRDSTMPIKDILLKLPVNEKIIFCGDGISLHKETISEALGSRAHYASALSVLPHAASSALIAYEGSNMMPATTYKDLLPNYLRKSQAQIELESKQQDMPGIAESESEDL